jgi:hypothetical protein
MALSLSKLIWINNIIIHGIFHLLINYEFMEIICQKIKNFDLR